MSRTSSSGGEVEVISKDWSSFKLDSLLILGPTYYKNYIGTVPDHDGGRPKQINAWFLYTNMVYL
jgi:hypothetical protein